MTPVPLSAGALRSKAFNPPRTVLSARSGQRRGPYDTAPDGQRFLVRAVPQQQASQPLTVIVNWPALLKQGAAAQ